MESWGVGICCQQSLIIFIPYFFSLVFFSTIFSIISPITALVNPNKFIYEERERAGLVEEIKMVNKRSQQRGLNKGAWTAEEDQKLVKCVIAHGEKQWRTLPALAGLKRCGKSCRLRWLNYLRPGIKRGNISEEEEDLIIRLHNLLGNKWSLIAGRIPGRTDNEIKNHWNTHLCKRSVTIDDLNEKLNARLLSSGNDSSPPPPSTSTKSNSSFPPSRTDHELGPDGFWAGLAHSEFDIEDVLNFGPTQTRDLGVEDYGIVTGLDGCQDPFTFNNEAIFGCLGQEPFI